MLGIQEPLKRCAPWGRVVKWEGIAEGGREADLQGTHLYK